MKTAILAAGAIYVVFVVIVMVVGTVLVTTEWVRAWRRTGQMPHREEEP